MSEKQQERRQEGRRRFEEKTAIITGAAGDLGSTSARQLSEEGARVILFDLPSTEAALKQLVTELSGQGGKGSIYVCGDVTSVEEISSTWSGRVWRYRHIVQLCGNRSMWWST